MTELLSCKDFESAMAANRLSVRDFLRGKRVLVTGACGTVGRRLTSRLLQDFEIGSIVGLDHNESALASLAEEHCQQTNATFLLADMRDYTALSRELREVDVLFHAAAYKHVHMCERSPLEAIHTNILGVQNIIQAAVDNGVARLVFTSSDKAVNPTSVMGASKLMGERLTTAAAGNAANSDTIMLSTRFGNVVGSRGSVMRVFYEQIRRGGPITLTDPNMTRFIMTLDDAVDLIIDSVTLGASGDVLLAKMEAIRISDLAEILIWHYAPIFGRRAKDIEIKTVGPRPGEKLFEELMNEEETRRALELNRHYVIRPTSTVHAMSKDLDYLGQIVSRVVHPYNSANVKPLSRVNLRKFLIHGNLIHDERRLNMQELVGAA